MSYSANINDKLIGRVYTKSIYIRDGFSDYAFQNSPCHSPSKNIVLGTELNGVNSLNYGQVVILCSCDCTALSGTLIPCIYSDSVSLISVLHFLITGR